MFLNNIVFWEVVLYICSVVSLIVPIFLLYFYIREKSFLLK